MNVWSRYTRHLDVRTTERQNCPHTTSDLSLTITSMNTLRFKVWDMSSHMPHAYIYDRSIHVPQRGFRTRLELSRCLTHTNLHVSTMSKSWSNRTDRVSLYIDATKTGVLTLAVVDMPDPVHDTHNKPTDPTLQSTDQLTPHNILSNTTATSTHRTIQAFEITQHESSGRERCRRFDGSPSQRPRRR